MRYFTYHRDYFATSTTMIEIFDDRVEITNPGGLPSGLTSNNFGTISIPRNPLLADLLLRVGYIEKIGTGINRIKSAVKEHGINIVKFIYDEHFFQVVFLRGKESPTATSSVQSSVQILELIEHNPRITAKQIAAELGITIRAVEKNIAALKQSGILERVGPNKTGSWKVLSINLQSNKHEK